MLINKIGQRCECLLVHIIDEPVCIRAVDEVWKIITRHQDIQPFHISFSRRHLDRHIDACIFLNKIEVRILIFIHAAWESPTIVIHDNINLRVFL
ncbi:Uncharacterised protein [Mycobacteroides abscessus subsp. abscessus]|nr:Uncharacterised protein [Mycobacteroides abscessus subsp. abscessus]